VFDFGVDTIRIIVDQLHLGYLGDGLLNGVVRRAINRLLGGDFIGYHVNNVPFFQVSSNSVYCGGACLKVGVIFSRSS
jgi:hypothetical protein